MAVWLKSMHIKTSIFPQEHHKIQQAFSEMVQAPLLLKLILKV